MQVPAYAAEEQPRRVKWPGCGRSGDARERHAAQGPYATSRKLWPALADKRIVAAQARGDSLSLTETNMKKILLLAIVGTVLVAGSYSFARPADNVNPARHPNIAAAQRLSTQAYEKIVAAQKANEWDLNGHAQKAKELLDQVNAELKQAAEASNAHH